MLSPYKIAWDGISSLDLDLLTECCFDSDSGDVSTHLSRDAVVSEFYNGSFKRAHGYKWGETLTFSVTLVKQDFSDFTEQENRRILKWLTGSPNASFLDVYKDDTDVISWSALGNWINVSSYKLANNRIVGYVAEFESMTPWALSPLQTLTKNISTTADNIMKIVLETDEPQSPVYPRITIKQNEITNIVELAAGLVETDEWLPDTVYHHIEEDGAEKYYWVDAVGKKHTSDTNTSDIEETSVKIINTYTGEDGQLHEISAKILRNIKGETVVLDGANRVVSSSRTDGRIFGDDFSWKWLPLIEGENNISVIGNCSVTIEWRSPMKCGEF